MFLSILLNYSNKSYYGYDGYYDDNASVIIFVVLIVIPVVLILLSIVDWEKLIKDLNRFYFKNIKGRVKVDNIPTGLKFNLLNIGVKNRDIKEINLLYHRRLKRMDTYFAYEIITKRDLFHMYYYKNSWFIYKNGSFDNKVLNIKYDYYDIVKDINNRLFKKIRGNFYKRLKEQSC